jgi:hypothetical protein
MATEKTALLRIEATADVASDGGRSALDRMRRLADGDGEYGTIVDLAQAGVVLVVDLLVAVTARADDGRHEHAECRNRGVILERGDIPDVERQVSEISGKDYAELREALRERGVDIDGDALERAFVHVALTPALRAELEG